jgi:2-amino-4-hydroxy-6-hydroxymethyldihydropteridine diphosphokinase
MTAVLSLGSNVGDRWKYLRTAVDLLRPVATSPVYESAPWGGVAQPDFLNMVVVCDCDAAEAWRRAQAAEEAAGRVRDVRWGPRTLDVDVIVADGEHPDLALPHPLAQERAFVLVPWLDVDPEAELPGYGPVALLDIDEGSVRLVGALDERS